MKVFRAITVEEIKRSQEGFILREAILRGDGTHNYEKNTSYIHFFKYSQSAEYYFASVYDRLGFTSFAGYMVADIPDQILEKHQGYGFYSYDSKVLGDDFCFEDDIIPMPEYAIPYSLLKKEYIVSIDRYINRYFKTVNSDYENYLGTVKNIISENNIVCYKGVVRVLEKNKSNKTIENDSKIHLLKKTTTIQ